MSTVLKRYVQEDWVEVRDTNKKCQMEKKVAGCELCVGFAYVYERGAGLMVLVLCPLWLYPTVLKNEDPILSHHSRGFYWGWGVGVRALSASLGTTLGVLTSIPDL